MEPTRADLAFERAFNILVHIGAVEFFVLASGLSAWGLATITGVL